MVGVAFGAMICSEKKPERKTVPICKLSFDDDGDS